MWQLSVVCRIIEPWYFNFLHQVTSLGAWKTEVLMLTFDWWKFDHRVNPTKHIVFFTLTAAKTIECIWIVARR